MSYVQGKFNFFKSGREGLLPPSPAILFLATRLLNPVDIFHRWCKLNFGLLQDPVKSRYLTAILLKR